MAGHACDSEEERYNLSLATHHHTCHIHFGGSLPQGRGRSLSNGDLVMSVYSP